MFSLDEVSLNLVGFSADGGADSDTANFASGTYDETEVDGVITNFEILDFTAAGSIADLDLSSNAIQNMTDGANELTIRINSGGGDSVTVTDPAANVAIDTAVPNQTVYTIYDGSDHGTATELAELTVLSVA